MCSHGCKDATTNPDQINKWWEDYPNANIGIATGKLPEKNKYLIVVDCDVHKDRNGYKELYEYQEVNTPLPTTLTARSGSGGTHYYLLSEKPYKNAVNILENYCGHKSGVDVRGVGGYIVAPPSIHPDTKSRYKWQGAFDFSKIADGGTALDKLMKDGNVSIDGAKPATPPKWTSTRLKRKTDKAEEKPTDEYENILIIAKNKGLTFKEGKRNNDIHKLACCLQYRGYTDNQINDYCNRVNSECCSPPLPDKEVEGAIRSALKAIPKGDKLDGSKDKDIVLPRINRSNFKEYLETICLPPTKIKYNEITHKLDITGRENEYQELLPDTMPAILMDEMSGFFSGVTMQRVKEYMQLVASENAYNPVLDLIESAEWDGVDRINEIYRIFGIGEDDTLSRAVIKKWLMQAVCILHNNIEHPFSADIVLVFQGNQGVGKTRFFERLALGFFGEGKILDPKNKDSVMEITRKWISELGEIGSTMRKDIDSVKAFISCATDEYRAPYGQTSVTYPRRTSFVGTVNEEDYLVDQTGNRRFATVPIRPDVVIDYERDVKTFDAIQLWAQVNALIKKEIADKNSSYAAVFRLSRDELEAMEQRNGGFKKLLRGEQEVLDTLASYEQNVREIKVTYQFCTVSDFKIANEAYLRNVDVGSIGKVLKKLNFESKVDGHSHKTLYKLPWRVSGGSNTNA